LNFETVSLSDLGWVLNEIVKLDLDLKNLNLFMSAMHHARCDSLFVSLLVAIVLTPFCLQQLQVS